MKKWNQLDFWLSSNKMAKKDTELVDFVQQHQFLPTIDVDEELEKFFFQAGAGLNENAELKKNSSLLMANSFIRAANVTKNVDLLPAVVIDAGGTNLRIVGVENKDNQPFFSFYEKQKMPGTEKTISAEDFFHELSLLIIPILKKKPFDTLKEIKFCFSYPFFIDSQGEARVIELTKEISIENINNAAIDTTLKKCINEQLGENRIENIVVLNDAVATLLASYMEKSSMTEKSTKIGLVLGTGLNMAYEEYQLQPCSIINTEVGGYNQLPRTIIDKKIDEMSAAPNKGLLEKAVSGAYLGHWIYECLLLATNQSLIDKNVMNKIDKNLKMKIISQWLTDDDENEWKELTGEMINIQTKDGQRIKNLISMAVTRSVNLASMASYLVLSWAVRHQKPPHDTPAVTISINGSVMTKTHNYLQKYKENIDFLTKNHKMNIVFADVEHSPTMGSLYAQKVNQ